jgi:hypothetical protein
MLMLYTFRVSEFKTAPSIIEWMRLRRINMAVVVINPPITVFLPQVHAPNKYPEARINGMVKYR